MEALRQAVKEIQAKRPAASAHTILALLRLDYRLDPHPQDMSAILAQ